MERDGREYIIIDTAGVRKRGKVTETVEKFSVIKTLQAVGCERGAAGDCAREGISDQDLSLLGFILNATARSLVIAINKWDGADRRRSRARQKICWNCVSASSISPVFTLSPALHGSGVDNLFDSVREAYDCATRRVSTILGGNGGGRITSRRFWFAAAVLS